ncbi:MAG TPA: hypothetical protein VF103_10045, partial [Polyangiaceae bacterium]
MRSLDRSSSGVVVVRRHPTRAVTLSGTLAFVLAVVPLVIAPELGATQILASLCFALAGAALFYLGRSRREPSELRRTDGGIAWGDEPLPPPAFLALDGKSLEDPPTYQAFVVWSDGQRRLALEHTEPSVVLEDALLVAERLELELRPGWGLEDHLPETGPALLFREALARGAPNGVTGASDLPAFPMQKRPALVTLVAGAFVVVETVFLARSPARLVVPSSFALALAGIAAMFPLAVGSMLLGLRRRVEVSRHGIESTSVLFGMPLKRRVLAGVAPSRVFGVSPDGGPVRHLLFATAGGSLSVAADDESIRRLVSPADEPATRDGPRARAELGATSARYR